MQADTLDKLINLIHLISNFFMNDSLTDTYYSERGLRPYISVVGAGLMGATLIGFKFERIKSRLRKSFI